MTNDLINNWKAGDIFRWSWNKKTAEYFSKDGLNSLSSYWCMSQIGIVNEDGVLVDTYWGGGYCSKSFTKQYALDSINVEFIANQDDLIPSRESEQAMYKDEDFINLNHPNTHGKYYLRKDAVKCEDKMRLILKRNIYSDYRKLVYLIQSSEYDLQKLNQGNGLDFVCGNEGVYLSDTSYVDDDLDNGISKLTEMLEILKNE